MTWVQTIGFAIFCFLCVANPITASATTYHVDTAETLQETWESTGPGDVIALEGISFGNVILEGGGGAPSRPITLTSVDPERPARFSGLILRGVSHVVLEEVVLDYTFIPADALRAQPFQVFNARDIVLQNLLFDGDMAHGMDAFSDGLPVGFGLSVAKTSGLTLRHSEFRHFWRGLTMRESDDLHILRNHLHNLRMDGMNFAQVENVLIEENLIRNFQRSPDKRDHADMIQFWTRHTKKPSRNVTIRNNIMNSENGLHTQSIFLGNGLALAGDEEMFYRNFTIENNLIINAHKHGIAMGPVVGVRIGNNTLVHNPASDGPRDIAALYRPQILVHETARDVVVENNIATGFSLETSEAGWTSTDNIVIQDSARNKAYHYSMLFAGHDRTDPASFKPKPGGPLDGSRIGVDFLALQWLNGL